MNDGQIYRNITQVVINWNYLLSLGIIPSFSPILVAPYYHCLVHELVVLVR